MSNSLIDAFMSGDNSMCVTFEKAFKTDGATKSSSTAAAATAPKKKRTITQATFDEVVKENLDDFEMERDEALADARSQFEAQGVDLSTIVTSDDAATAGGAPARVLVVGGSGYIGQFVVRRLLDETESVVALTYWSSVPPSSTPPRLTVLRCDLQQDGDITRVVQAFKPTAVIHCAAMASLGACAKDKATALAINCPAELLRVLKAQCPTCRLIYTSTDQVFPGQPAQHAPWREGDATAPENVYGETKLAFEQMMAKEWPEGQRCVARLSNVYGARAPLQPAGRDKFLQWVLEKLQSDEATTLWTDEKRNFVFVEDVAAALCALALGGEDNDGGVSELPPVLHLAGPAALSRVDFAKAVLAEWKIEARFVQVVQSKHHERYGAKLVEKIVGGKRGDMNAKADAASYVSPLDLSLDVSLAGALEATKAALMMPRFRSVQEGLAATRAVMVTTKKQDGDEKTSSGSSVKAAAAKVAAVTGGGAALPPVATAAAAGAPQKKKE